MLLGIVHAAPPLPKSTLISTYQQQNIWSQISVADFTKWFQSIFTVGGWRIYPFNLPLLPPAYIPTQSLKRPHFEAWTRPELETTSPRFIFFENLPRELRYSQLCSNKTRFSRIWLQVHGLSHPKYQPPWPKHWHNLAQTRAERLWKFSVQVQSWSDKIDSDPVLIRKIFENHQSDPVLVHECKIICIFILPHEAKEILKVFLPLAKYDWLKAKLFQQCFCVMRQNRHSLLAFAKFNKEVSIWHQKEKHCWSSFAIRRIQLLGLVKW